MNEEWKPIATHPTDGSWFLIWDGEHYEVVNCPPNCFMGKWDMYKKEWNGSSLPYYFKPTHWRKLPEPPKSIF